MGMYVAETRHTKKHDFFERDISFTNHFARKISHPQNHVFVNLLSEITPLKHHQGLKPSPIPLSTQAQARRLDSVGKLPGLGPGSEDLLA